LFTAETGSEERGRRRRSVGARRKEVRRRGVPNLRAAEREGLTAMRERMREEKRRRGQEDLKGRVG
jgi:hypothetical protein